MYKNNKSLIYYSHIDWIVNKASSWGIIKRIRSISILQISTLQSPHTIDTAGV